MKIIEKIHNLFLFIPPYLRGLVVFVSFILISVLVNKIIGPVDYWDTEIGKQQKMEILKMANENKRDVENSDLSEKIEIDDENNIVKGSVKENTKSKRNKKVEVFNDLKGDFVFGSATAPVTIIDYSSYTCPHCKDFHFGTVSNLMKDYVNTGKVKYVKRMVIQQSSLLGVMLPYCINNNDNRYKLIGELYKKSNMWINDNGKEKELKEIALNNGFTEKSFYDCIRNKELAQGLINKQSAEMDEVNIFFTPTIFINGKMIGGNIAYNELSKKIDEILNTSNK
ncbi:MAG: thioredoxin domain-containing protein [Rickettsiales bacterium]|nr:thioredoxin domain-containing protein [Rickettsiales bacterium]